MLDYSGSLQIPKLQSRVRSPSVSKSTTSSSSSSDSSIKPTFTGKITDDKPKLMTMAPPAYQPRQSSRLKNVASSSSSEDESSVGNVRGATGSKKVPLNDVKIKTPSPPSSIVSGIFIFTFIQSSTYSST